MSIVTLAVVFYGPKNYGKSHELNIYM